MLHRQARSLSKMVAGFQPALNLGRVLVDDQGKQIPMHFDHGTTTLGFKYQVLYGGQITNSIVWVP